MRIKTLRIKNLNSLRGDFAVDFSPESILGRAGLFAITGTIGAGKTTILDAICVALFGQTPRLDSRNVSEIMSRHTGDCYSEVDFSINRTDYRCRWAQRRAHNKPDGKLQPPVMELSELTGEQGTILEEKKTEVIKRIEHLTGLDFDRFTRSIMLAQGNFAAFLNAKDNERADLLEKMTGTAIYSDISRAVYERFKTEKQNLKDLELQVDNIQLMPEEEVIFCKNEQINLENQVKERQSILKTFKSQLIWLEQIVELESGVSQYSEKLEHIKQKKEDHKKDLDTLQKARMANPFKADYEILKHQRHQVTSLTKTRDKYLSDLPELKEKLSISSAKICTRQKNFQSFLTDYATQEEKILETLKKDTAIRSTREQLSHFVSRKETILNKLRDIAQEQNRHHVQAEKVKSSIQGFSSYLNSNQHNQSIPGELPYIEELIRSTTRDKSEIKNIKGAEAELNQHIKSAKEEGEALSVLFQQQTAELEITHKKITQTTNEQALITKEKDLSSLESEKLVLVRKKEGISRLLEIDRDISEIQKDIEKTTELQNKKKKELEASLLKENKNRAQLETEIVLQKEMEEKLRLERMIKDYEKDRKDLKPDTPCPLCGSVSHPWAEGYEAHPDQTQSILEDQQKKVQDIQSLLQNLQTQNTILKTEIEQRIKNLSLYESSKDNLTQKWISTSDQLKLGISIDNGSNLSSMLETYSYDLQQLETIIKNAYQLQKVLQELSVRNQHLSEQKNNTQIRLEKNRSQLTQLTERLTSGQGETERLEKQIESYHKKLESCLRPYEELDQALIRGNFITIIETLKKRAADYSESEKNLKNLEKELNNLNQAISGFKINTTQLKSQQDENQKQLEALESLLNRQLNERNQMLGDQDPIQLKESLNSQKQAFENDLKQMENDRYQLKNDVELKEQLLKKCSEDLKLNTQKLSKLSEQFFQSLEASDMFQSEEDYQSALIPDDVFRRMENFQKDLLQQETSITSNLQETRKKLKQKREENQTDVSRETLQNKENENLKILQEQQQKLGALSEKLTQHHNLVQKQAEHIKKINLQRKEFDQWNQLNTLIGSADGMKFRRFAQGLTLDYLITLANRNLEKLNNRYILKRNGKEELGLEVIDTFQANITRPTNTLSGGESFLTSLALALGLSNLASKNTQIDSLFLDEGFGTLDTETLEMALDALNSLNATGKTIGIISHVEALKERVPVQLKVIKQAGGVSSIQISE